MKEIPILMSAPMVRAIIDRRKRKTRRVIKPQPIDNREEDGNFFYGHHKGYVKVDGHPDWQRQFAHEFCKLGPVGSMLWVRESCLFLDSHPTPGWIYKADCDNNILAELKAKGYRWRPSILMPKEASRIWLEVEKIRIERLHDINTEDAIAEGIESSDHLGLKAYKDYTGLSRKGRFLDGSNYSYANGSQNHTAAVASYCTLWNDINGEGSWNENPWVWVVEFKVLSTDGKPNL